MFHGKRLIRKTARPHKRAYRRFRSSRRGYIRRNKRFQRRLNQVAEKKMAYTSQAGNIIVASNTHGTLAQGIKGNVIPAIGADQNQRIGSKYFLRYATLRIHLANVNVQNMVIGRLGFVMLSERAKNANAACYVDTVIFPGGHTPDQINYRMLKNSYKKIYFKQYMMTAPPDANGYNQGNGTWNLFIKKRVRIMKTVTVCQDGSIDLPDIYWGLISFPAPYTAVTGAITANYSLNLSYTDV